MLTSNTEGLRVLHRLLVTVRFRARDGASGDDLASMLDSAETLLSYVLAEEDMTELFEEQLQALGEEFPDRSGIGKDYRSQTV